MGYPYPKLCLCAFLGLYSRAAEILRCTGVVGVDTQIPKNGLESGAEPPNPKC